MIINQQAFRIRYRNEVDLAPSVSLSERLHESSHSVVYRQGKAIYKLVKVRRYAKDSYEALLKKSRTAQEVNSNRYLAELGFRVPELYFWGYAPGSRRYSEALVMENLEDYETIKQSVQTLRENKVLNKVLLQVAADLNTLISQDMYFRDFHFDNVMANARGEIAWIDTALSHFKKKEKLYSRMTLRMRHLEEGNEKSKLFERSEWELFHGSLKYSDGSRA